MSKILLLPKGISWLMVCALLFVFVYGCGNPPPIDDELIADSGLQDRDPHGEFHKEAVIQPDDSTLPEKELQCKHRCDCQQGLDCVQGACIAGLEPVYCCEKRGCPVGKACLSLRGGSMICGAKDASCQTSCDCQDGLSCLNGLCSDVPDPVYCCERKDNCPPGAKCETHDGKSQKCPGEIPPPTCKTHCDCPQSQSCVHEKCVQDFTPTYCCTKPNCKDGEPCFNPDGSPGICGKALCRNDADCGTPSCSQLMGECVAQQPYCDLRSGLCSSRTQRMANALCRPDGNCEPRPQACQSHCDCPAAEGCIEGRCVRVMGQEFWCCTDPSCPNNSPCFNKDNTKGQCGSSPGCRSDRDCPASSCRDSGLDCVQTRHVCQTQSGKCLVSDLSISNATCDQKLAQCVPRPPVCKVDCDCSQGSACIQGQCRISSLLVYCCDKSGCPEGSPCTRTDGSPGTCSSTPTCITDLDCGKTYCIQRGSSCETRRPTCQAGKCAESSSTQPNATCDTSGQCKPGCQSDADCKKSSCTQIGQYCELTAERCISGACHSSTSRDVGICDSSAGICKPPVTCHIHCDCPQGQFCYDGQCLRSSYPVYCCENPGCPAGAPCYGKDYSPGTCPTPCTSVCDCPEGQACTKNICTTSSTPQYCCDKPQLCPPGSTCTDRNNKTGTCPNQPRPCKTVCDCVNGEDCINGQCAKSSKPVYCCEKDLCPVGQPCVSKAMLSGFCPQTCQGHCDCPQGYNCLNGRCINDPALTGNIYCCTNPNCPANNVCYHPDGQRDYCPSQRCQSPCDCNQGEDCYFGRCVPADPPVFCCSKIGCPSGQSCKNSQNQWQTCPATTPCKHLCDCEQGQDCYKGLCVGVYPPIYCCAKVGCPSGQPCYDDKNQLKHCPITTCKTACDCPIQGQSCIHGRCVYLTESARIYCCNKPYCPAGQPCEDDQGNLKLCSSTKCNSPCDCSLGEDCRNGICVSVSPPVLCCTSSYCPPRQPCIKPDNTRSQCAP